MSEEIEVEPITSSDIDDTDGNYLQPAGRRWDPLGEAASPAAPSDGNDTTIAQYDTDS